MRSPRLGDEIRIRFLDHTEGESDVDATCEYFAYGRVVRVTRTEIVIDGWVAANSDERGKYRNDTTTWAIIRKAILAIDRAVEWEEL